MAKVLSRSAQEGSAFSWYDGLEAGALFLSTPFLLFPTFRPAFTGGAVLLAAVVLVMRWRTRGAAPVTPLNGPMALWALMVVVGAGVTAFPALMLPKATGLLLGFWMWLAAARIVRTERLLVWSTLGFAALGLALAGQGLLTTDWPVKVPVLSAVIARLPRALVALPGAPDAGIHANELAGAVVPYLPLALSMGVGLLIARAQKRTRPRVLGILGAVMGAGAVLALLILSQSRSAWIGGFLGTLSVIVLWAILSPPGPWRTALWIGLSLLVLIIVGTLLWLGPAGLARLWSGPEQLSAVGGVGSLGFRVEVWRWAVSGIQDFPFTGCGLGAFREVGRLLYPMNIAPDYDFAHAHNIFLQVALDMGIPGLIAYLALLGTAVAMAWQVARRNPVHRAPALGLLGGLIALHGYGMTDALAPGAKPGLVFWAMLGLITALYRLAFE